MEFAPVTYRQTMVAIFQLFSAALTLVQPTTIRTQQRMTDHAPTTKLPVAPTLLLVTTMRTQPSTTYHVCTPAVLTSRPATSTRALRVMMAHVSTVAAPSPVLVTMMRKPVAMMDLVHLPVAPLPMHATMM